MHLLFIFCLHSSARGRELESDLFVVVVVDSPPPPSLVALYYILLLTWFTYLFMPAVIYVGREVLSYIEKLRTFPICRV